MLHAAVYRDNIYTAPVWQVDLCTPVDKKQQLGLTIVLCRLGEHFGLPVVCGAKLRR